MPKEQLQLGHIYELFCTGITCPLYSKLMVGILYSSGGWRFEFRISVPRSKAITNCIGMCVMDKIESWTKRFLNSVQAWKN